MYDLSFYFKEVSYAHEGCMYLIKNSNIVKTTVFYLNML